MSESGVIPPRAEREPYRHLVGAVHAEAGQTVRVGVDHDSVTISGEGPLTSSECEDFAQIFIAAVWTAGLNAQRMREEVTHEPEFPA